MDDAIKVHFNDLNDSLSEADTNLTAIGLEIEQNYSKDSHEKGRILSNIEGIRDKIATINREDVHRLRKLIE